MTPVHIAAARGEPEVWLELYRAPAVVDYGESIGDEPVSSAVRFERRSSMVGEKLATLSTTTQPLSSGQSVSWRMLTCVQIHQPSRVP